MYALMREARPEHGRARAAKVGRPHRVPGVVLAGVTPSVGVAPSLWV